MKTVSNRKEMRHLPIQARSSQRVESILDSASQLISEVGYDRATTNDVAKRAGVPIGSLYQYFPNKEALLHALSRRYLVQLREYLTEAIDRIKPATLSDYLSLIIDSVIEFRRSHKSFKQMFLGIHMNNELSVSAKEMNDEFIALIESRLKVEKAYLNPEQRIIVSYIIIGMMRSLFVSMTLLDEKMWEAMRVETKNAMKAYLHSLKA